jgi:hypothetical protein
MTALLSLGCDRRSASTPATPPAATQAAVATTHPSAPATTTAASTEPTSSFMKINGRIVEFPAARLKINDEGQRLSALLFSNDPPQAIKDDYTGNSFYLNLSLPVKDVEELQVAHWEHRARSSEREDSPYGIYLSGRKVQLQPYDVHASFAPQSEQHYIVHLSGQFMLWNDADSSGLPQMISLAADLPVVIEAEAVKKP